MLQFPEAFDANKEWFFQGSNAKQIILPSITHDIIYMCSDVCIINRNNGNHYWIMFISYKIKILSNLNYKYT